MACPSLHNVKLQSSDSNLNWSSNKDKHLPFYRCECKEPLSLTVSVLPGGQLLLLQVVEFSPTPFPPSRVILQVVLAPTSIDSALSSYL